MAREKSDRARDREINRKFEEQGRRLNRKRMRNALGGIVLLVVILVVLQFTPYRDLPRDVFDAAKDFVLNLTFDQRGPAEPDPQYW